MTDSARYQQICEVFAKCVEAPPGDREAILAEHAAGDKPLRAEVERLLARDATQAEDVFADAAIERARAAVSGLLDGVESSRGADAADLPRTIGPYAIKRVIGRGGMGVVYEGRQEHPSRSVAVKVLRSGMATPALVRRFEREVQALGRLQDPGIAHIYEAGTATIDHEERPFLAMEYVEGLPIDAHVREHGLGARQVMELVAQTCDSLQHAHQRGVIHRDLKPSNVLVAQPPPDARQTIGQPKILDFGVARLMDAQNETIALCTQAGQLLGTLVYMSPEQLRDDSADLDIRCDVYALGALLYELLAGRGPFDFAGISITEAARTITQADPPRLGTLNPDLRGDVETIVAKAMDKDRERRYASAGELAADIRRFLRDQPIDARPATTFYQIRKFARRNRALVAGFVATLLALSAGLVATTWFAVKESRSADAFAHASYRAGLAAAVAALRENDVASAERYLESTPPPLRGWEWRHLHARLDESAASAAIETADQATLGRWPNGHIWFSDDGTLIYVAIQVTRERSGVGSVLVETRRAETLELVASRILSDALRFAPAGGDSLFVALSDQSVTVLDLTTDASRPPDPDARDPGGPGIFKSRVPLRAPAAAFGPAASMGSVRRACVAFSPGNRSVAVWRDQRIGVFSFDPVREIAMLPDHAEGVADAAFTPDGSRLLTAGYNRRLAMFDVRSQGALLWAVDEAHTDALLAVEISPDGSLVATGGQDAVLRFWDAHTGAPLGGLVGHRSPIAAIAFSPSGDVVATCSAGGIRTWPLAEAGPLKATDVAAHNRKIEAVALSPDGSLLATFDDRIRLWDAASNSPIAQIVRDDLTRPSLGFSQRNGRLCLDVVDRGSLFTIDVSTGEEAGRFAPPPGRPGDWIVVNDGAVAPQEAANPGLWSPQVREALAAIDYRRLDLAFDPASERMAIQMDDRIVVFHYASRAVLSDFVGPANASLLLFADGRRLAVGTRNGPILIHDADSGRLLRTLRGHAAPVLRMAALPAARRLVSASDDRTIRLWDLTRMEETIDLRGHTDRVEHLAVSPDGLTIYSGAGDYTVRRWDTRPAGQISRARLEYGRVAARLTPRIEAMFDAFGEPSAVAEQVEADDALSERERQIVLRRSLAP